MPFTSILFFLFLTGTLIVYYLLSVRFRNYFLIAASAVFYIYAGAVFFLLLAAMILANFLIGLKLEQATVEKIRKGYLILGVGSNLVPLIFFKYWNFLVGNLAKLLSVVHWDFSFHYLDIVLPIGLSYYVFQFIAYLIDIYWKHEKAERDIFRFSLFIMFFPKMQVGPIERAGNFLPQLRKKIFFDQNNLVEGGKRIVWGLFKKLVVADRIAIYQSAVMSAQDQQSGITMLFASLIYTFQVYADFSGYTDIALGTARLFGFNLMENFKRPLLAKNMGEFWRRWHISLSSWVNDYVFTPLAFKRRSWGIAGVFYSLALSFAIIGIWHGSTWNYLAFGLLQAVALMYEYLTRRFRKKMAKTISPVIYNNLSIVATFLYISFCLVIFRTDTFSHAGAMLNSIVTHSGPLFYDKPSTLLFILIGCLIMMLHDVREEFKLFRSSLVTKNWIVQQVTYALLIIYILLAGVFDGGQFIYLAY
ncbi:MAG TPA: MBOAT family O-acyltransferase [Chitinophagaceae bacterium]|nr:MBOAT family O-acyltransferase [Chitinophagaceae bacterium]